MTDTFNYPQFTVRMVLLIMWLGWAAMVLIVIVQ